MPSRFLPFALVMAAFLACTPAPDQTLQKLVIKLESKYKRDADRNDIDLHFQAPTGKKILVVLRYKSPSDRDLAESIGSAAVDLVKRVAAEDPEFRDLQFEVEKVVKPR